MLQGLTHSRTIRTALLAGSLAVWLPPLGAQFDASAKVLVQNGQVSILKDGYQVPVFVGDPIRPRSVIVSGPDGYAKLQTSDGSTFEVFPNAKVTFREDYPNFGDLIQVLMGKIRVQIDHHKGPNPNKVSTPTAVISVRGTIFDVVDEDQDHTTLVAVEEGVVEVIHRRIPNNRITLQTGESREIFWDQPLAKVNNGAFHDALWDRIKQAGLDAVYTHPGGLGGHGPVGGGTSGPQGDQCGSKTGCQSGGTKGPGAPPAPGVPPAPGGGGGN
jgi:FecR protein